MMKSKNIIVAAVILATIFLCPIKSDSQVSGLVKPVVALTGNVFNQATFEPVTAFMIVLDQNGKRVNQTRSNAAENGHYYLTGLESGKTYTINIRQRNFFKESYDIHIYESTKYEEISKDFLIKPLEKGIKIKIPVTPFELRKSRLRFGSELALDDFVNTLKNNPEVKVEILCYPDDAADKSANKELTEERAEAIKEYFVSNGIETARLTVRGSESLDPDNPMPKQKTAKGKRYIGYSYIVVKDFPEEN